MIYIGWRTIPVLHIYESQSVFCGQSRSRTIYSVITPIAIISCQEYMMIFASNGSGRSFYRYILAHRVAAIRF